MAALPGDNTVVLPHATISKTLDLHTSQSELRRCGENYLHSEANCGAATHTDVWDESLDEQCLTFVNAHVAAGVPTEVETTEVQTAEVVGPPLSNFAGRKVKVRPSTSSMHCVSFHDLTYQVTQRKLCKRLPDKTILNSAR